jgi:hypothetical protein
MPNYVQGSPAPSGQPFPRMLMRGDIGFSFGAVVAQAIAASPTGLVRAANGQVTLTTTPSHNFKPGEVCTIANNQSVGGTRFGGNYYIFSTPSATTAVLVPIDDIILHQAPDVGGAGTASSVTFESPAAPQAGQAFSLAATPDIGQGKGGFSADGVFAGAPGAFEVDIQMSAADVDAQYQTISNGNIVAVDPTNNTFHFDAPTALDAFVRAKLLSRTNAVGLMVKFRG